jgi:transcriptional regulator with XRE-family HTH domain
MSDIAKLVSENLSRLLNNVGWNKAELARKSGLSRALVGNYLAGNHTPSLENLEILARTLGSTVTRILEGETVPVAVHLVPTASECLKIVNDHFDKQTREIEDLKRLTARMAQMNLPHELNELADRLLSALSDPELAERLQTTLDVYDRARSERGKEGKPKRKRS